MCETRNEYRVTRNANIGSSSSTSSNLQQSEVRAPRQRRPPATRNTTKARGEGPREGDGKDWTLVKRSSNSTEQKPRRGRPPRDKVQEQSQSS